MNYAKIVFLFIILCNSSLLLSQNKGAFSLVVTLENNRGRLTDNYIESVLLKNDTIYEKNYRRNFENE